MVTEVVLRDGTHAFIWPVLPTDREGLAEGYRRLDAEARYVATEQALGGVRVRDLMVRDPVTVDADSTIGRFMDNVAWKVKQWMNATGGPDSLTLGAAVTIIRFLAISMGAAVTSQTRRAYA